MAEISNYATLVTAVQDTAEDDSQEFLDYVPTAIGLAEHKLTRVVDALGMESTASVALSASSNSFAKPSGMRVPLVLSYANSAGSTVVLEKKTQSYIKDYWPVSTSVGEPKYYSDTDTTNFVVAPTSQNTITVEVISQGKPAALTSAAPSNYFTNFCPDALFYATMMEMSKFMKYFESTALWKQELEDTLITLGNESRRARRDEGDAPANPEGGMNTLRQDDH